jgi:hypothetical protein
MAEIFSVRLRTGFCLLEAAALQVKWGMLQGKELLKRTVFISKIRIL